MKQHIDDLLAGIQKEGEQHIEPVVANVEEGLVEAPIVPEGEEQSTGTPVEDQVSEEGSQGEEGVEPIVPEGAEGAAEEEDFIFEDWEEEGAEGAPAEPAPEVNLLEAVKGVVGDNVSDVDGLKEFITKLKQDNSALKEKANENPLENVPESLKEAVELAKEGKGDYLELLKITSVDYTKLDPATLAESDIRQYFYSDDGAFDEDGFMGYIENIPEKELEIKGKQRINELVHNQNIQKTAYLENVKREQQVSNDAIERAVSKLDKVADFKLNDGHRSNLARAMVNGGHKHVLEPKNSNGEINYNELAELVFIKQNFKRMMSVMKTRTQNALKGEVIGAIGNHTVAASADRAVHSPDGKKDPMDALIAQAQGNANRNSINTFYEQLKK